MSTDNTALTWRDLADQLTPEQIAGLERFEAELSNIPQKVDILLSAARHRIEYNLIDAVAGDVPVPPGAEVDTAGWERNPDDTGYSRTVVWHEETIGDVIVAVDGRQDSETGSFTRHISLYAGDGTRLTAAGARQLAAALEGAADEMERA